jgi:predicted phage terminase large subunit-like protein
MSISSIVESMAGAVEQREMSPREIAEAIIGREKAKGSLIEFCKFIDPSYEPFDIHYYLAERLEDIEAGRNRRLAIFVPPAIGKALALDTDIPTPFGWKAMGNIEVGDFVFGRDGLPCRVTAVSEVFKDRDCWEVSNQTGDSVVADGEHEWDVCVNRDKRSAGGGTFELCTTKFLADRQSGGERAPKLERAEAIEMPEADLPVHPYVLGLWLGDGATRNGEITIGDQDRDEQLFQLSQYGYEFGKRSNSLQVSLLGLQVKLRDIGVLNNKHIPVLYKRASPSQRFELLQGLIDSDGYSGKNGCIEYCTTDSYLAANVHELINSLGVRVSLNVGKAKLYGKDCGFKYRLNFYFPGAAKLRRKREGLVENGRPDHYLTFEPVGKFDTVCIEVDSPTHEFLCGAGFMPTHNSRLSSEFFPAWLFGRNPKYEFIEASYDDALAEGFGRNVRNLIMSPLYQIVFPETQIAQDSRAAGSWTTTEEGEYKAEGVRGGLIGFHANVAVLDDPVKGLGEASSESERERLWNWYSGTLLNRLRSYKGGVGAVVLIMQRWHDDDIGGRIEKISDLGEEEWEIVSIPSIAEEGDPLGRNVGEPLLPEGPNRRTIRELEAIRARQPNMFMAVHQQKPVGDDGDIFNPNWLLTYTQATLPEDLTYYGASDFGLSKGSGDYTVHAVVGIDTEGHVWIVDWWRGRVDPMEAVEAEIDFMVKYKPFKWFHENIGMQKVFGSLLERRKRELSIWTILEGVSIIKGGKSDVNAKVRRAGAVAGAMEMGYIHAPAFAAWLGPLQYELSRFPNGANDDQVDTLALIGMKLSSLHGYGVKKEEFTPNRRVDPCGFTFQDYMNIARRKRLGVKGRREGIVVPYVPDEENPLSDSYEPTPITAEEAEVAIHGRL